MKNNLKQFIFCVLALLLLAFLGFMQYAQLLPEVSVDQDSEVKKLEGYSVSDVKSEKTTDETITGGDEPPSDNRCVIIDDFSSVQDSAWFVINDGVMGGRSEGQFDIRSGVLRHYGVINTRGGGFASIRRALPANILVDRPILRVTLNSGGRPVTIRLEDRRYTRVSHSVGLTATRQMQAIEVDLRTSVPTTFGRRVTAEAYNPLYADQINFSINDGVDGPFEVFIREIAVCRE